MNYKQVFKTKGKMFIAITLSLGLTLLLSQYIFFHNTPGIDTRFLSKLFKRQTNNYPTVAPQPTVAPEIVENLIFEPTDKGISTATDETSGERYVKIEAGTVVEVEEYTLADGRRVTVIKPIY